MLRTIKRTRFIKGNVQIRLSLLSATPCSQAVPEWLQGWWRSEGAQRFVWNQAGGGTELGEGAAVRGFHSPKRCRMGD